MRTSIIIISLLLSTFYSCSNTQVKRHNSLLLPIEFAQKIKDTNSPIVVDVRTPEEYSKGHLNKSLNIDLNSEIFESQISLLDSTQPVFVYCLSGRRSSYAISKMHSIGFSKLYELNGGILKWRNAGFPETTD